MDSLDCIDIHTHIMPPKLPNFKGQFGYGGFIQLDHHKSCSARMLKDDGTFFREVNSNCWDPQVRISEFRDFGIGKQVLSTIPVLFNYWAKPEDGLVVSRFLNDHIGEVLLKYPEHFYGLGTIPLQDPHLAVEELRRCMVDLGLQGVEIGSHVNQWNLNASELHPFWAACEELGAAIFVHPWDMMGKDQMSDYWLPWLVGMPAETSRAICSMIFGGVFERYPALRVAFAHGGGSFSGTIGRIEHGFKVRPDLCAVDNDINPRAYLGRFFVDSLVHDPRALLNLIDCFGLDQVALGSDYPFPLGEHRPGAMIEGMEQLDEASKIKLLSHNAKRWLGVA